jgi:hypothetical protein
LFKLLSLQLACKTGREFRAVEICGLMPSSHTVQLAIKYASRLRLAPLAERLANLAREKAMEEAGIVQPSGEDEENEDIEDETEERMEFETLPKAAANNK